ncbi:MAG: tRNA (guanosine(46)-N7)-methyltransferase TrmB [Proteobacteria bacterium]|nr:tRNA (guanosine(46)-N7)-methyltransferase TrmB [Pseudomonadota bacterium]
MPVRTTDVFANILEKMDTSMNPFVMKLVNAQESGDLLVGFGPKLKSHIGAWRNQFPDMPSTDVTRPLIVEIGCHYGHTIADIAVDHPDALFVGIDITFKRVINTAERAKKLGLKNVLSVLANAGGLEHMFAPGEVNGFVTFFPDPWTKKKHAHNRLYSPKFCEAVWQALSPSGFLWLKTDQRPYFDDALSHAAAQGFEVTQSLPVFSDKDYSSYFMRRFQLMGEPWYGQKWVKPLS